MASVVKRGSGKKARYYVQWRDHNGQRRTRAAGRVKKTAQALAVSLEAQAREIDLGIRQAPGPQDRAAARPFEDVAREFIAEGRSRGGRKKRPWSRVHARQTELYLRFWHERLSLKTLGDVEDCLPAVEAALADMEEEGKAPRTLAAYLGGLRAFLCWCRKRRYLTIDPLDPIVGYSVEPRSKRRALTEEEVRRLLAVAPPHRRILYELALTSGLRAGEIRALTPEDLDVEGCAIRLRPEITKNRKAGHQPIPRALAQALAEHAKSGDADKRYKANHSHKPGHPAPTGRLVYLGSHPARELAEDLEAAGIPKTNPGGKLDFHSLRTSFVTLMAERGASVKELQTLARHSDPRITIAVYARARNERLQALAEGLGGMVRKPNVDLTYKAAAGFRNS